MHSLDRGPHGQVANVPDISPRGGPPGTQVTVKMESLPPGTGMLIGFGGLASGYQMIGEGETDQDGLLSQEVTVPENATKDELYFFFVAFGHDRPIGVSEAFHVTGADGSLRVTGEITDEAVGCTALRARNDVLYGLIGDTGGMGPGDRVVVDGTLGEASACWQGLPVQIRAIRNG